MRDLNFQLKQLCRRNPDGSFKTRANREAMLTQFAHQLHAIGYRHLSAHGLKPKHIDSLLKRWRQDELSVGTIKNRLAVLRWWTEKIDKQNIMARGNDYYGIGERRQVSNQSKAQSLAAEQLAKIADPSVRLSLELQQAFGLRREEAIKFIPVYADQGDYLRLKASWTKGGKARVIPIGTEHQRELLNRAHRLAGRGSLIPSNRRYIDQLRIYERYTAKAGLSKLHGLRHHYAQQRYEALTGWKSPAAGGPTAKQLSAEQKRQDRSARLIISRELGHERQSVVAVYCGR